MKIPKSAHTKSKYTPDSNAMFKPGGYHMMLDLWLKNDQMNSLNLVKWRELMKEMCRVAELEVVGEVSHVFSDNPNDPALTLLMLLAQSHASVHTWPESGYVSLDFYTCRPEEPDSEALMALVKTHVKPYHYTFGLLRRGIFPVWLSEQI